MAGESLVAAIENPGVAGMLGLFGLCAWMVFHPRSDDAPKILLFIMATLLFGPVSEAIMNAEAAGTPLKFNYFLYVVDQNLGISAFSVARLFTEWQRSILYLVYQSLFYVVILWYVLNLKIRGGRPDGLLMAYAVTFLIGPVLYLIVPASGPRQAFGNAFPMGHPDVSPVLVRLGGWPNAIPSLHLSTALLFVLFSGSGRAVRSIAWIYLAGTAAATLAFEHYLIDLIVGVPFACFAALAAEGKTRPSLSNLAMVLAWLIAIRFATPAMVAYPVLLRILACATVGLASLSLKSRLPNQARL